MTVTEAVPRTGRRPTIRLRPAPPCDPPFDDELSPEVWAPAHQPAFEWPAVVDGRAGPAAVEGRARSATPHAPASGGGVADGTGPGWVGAAMTAGDARLAVRRFVLLAVEVLNGHRPAAQLRRLAHPMDASRVVAQAVAGAHRVNQMRRAAGPGDRKLRRPSPVAVLRSQLCEPRPGAVEAAVLLVTGERTWAMAVRLELHHDSWVATVLRLI